jgi:hypothetical protein
MSAEQWEKRKRRPLLEDMEQAVSDHRLTWDRDAFPAAVEANLQAGRYTLVFAVDEITEELKDTVRYLGEHVAAEVNVLALEVDYLTDGETEVLVPRSYGQERAEQKAADAGVPLAPDEPSLMAVLRRTNGDWAEPIARSLLDWARTNDLLIGYGKGTKQGGAYLGHNDADGARRNLFGISTSGSVWIVLSSLGYWLPFESHESRVAVLRSLEAIDGGVREERLADTSSTVKLDSLRSPETFSAFTALLDDVVRRIRES